MVHIIRFRVYLAKPEYDIENLFILNLIRPTLQDNEEGWGVSVLYDSVVVRNANILDQLSAGARENRPIRQCMRGKEMYAYINI